MRIPLVDLHKQVETVKPAIMSKISELLDSASFIMGQAVTDFETQFAVITGVEQAVSCNSGTDALVLILAAMGIGHGDEVITTAFTYFATSDSISRVGAVPVFVDVDRDTFNLDVTQIEAAITEKTRAILPVHIFGQPADMEPILLLAKRYGLKVIEDACQAIGATYTFADGHTQPIGSLGDAAAFSFYPTKNLGAYGDGGMVTTNDDKVAQIVKALRTHGGGLNGKKAYELITGEVVELESVTAGTGDTTVYDPTKYYNFLIGMNSRLDSLQAGILGIKLDYLAGWNARRRQLSERYDQLIHHAGLAEKLPSQQTLLKAQSVRHLYVVICEERAALAAFLGEQGIATGIYYPVPLHLQMVYQVGKAKLGYQAGDFPVCEWLSQRTIALPLFPEMTEEQQDRIINEIKEFYSAR